MKIILTTAVLLMFSSIIVFSQEYEFGLEKGVSIGTPVSTVEYVEYSPAISADGKTLVFESNKAEDWRLFISYFTDEGWSEPVYMDKVNLKSSTFDGGPFLSYDGNYLIITSTREGGLGYTDIWISERMGTEWQKPINIGPPINTDGYDGFASMTSDGNEMFFMRMDTTASSCSLDNDYAIYSSLKVDGKWSEPVKLPYPINTDYCEGFPRILADNKTLFFSSSREGSLGELDLYKSVRQDDGSWSEPINLGSFINTEEEDILVSVPASGNIMFYTSSSNDITDIFSVPIPVDMQYEALITVTGAVFDGKTRNPLFANIKITNQDDESDSTSIKSNKVDGKFVVLLNKGKKYDVSVSAKDYMFYSTSFDLVNLLSYEEYKKNIYLEKIKVGASMILNNIFFEPNSANLMEESKFELSRIIILMNENQNLVVEIGGHTDSDGSDEFNNDLSQKRANSVVDFLVKNGIEKNRLISKGYGENVPIATNDTEEGKKQNRRVEFKILNN